MTDLKKMYVTLREKSLRIGLLPEECRIVGEAVRKLSFDARKKLLEDAGLWDDNIIYKNVMTEDGLMKLVINKRAMNYEKKKNAKNSKNHTSDNHV